jgi:peroxiredoxin family protein
MKKYLEIIIIVTFFTFLGLILFSLKVALGAGAGPSPDLSKAMDNLRVYGQGQGQPVNNMTVTMIKEDTDAFNYLEQACIMKDIKLKYCKTILALIDEFNIPWNGEGKDPMRQ